MYVYMCVYTYIPAWLDDDDSAKLAFLVAGDGDTFREEEEEEEEESGVGLLGVEAGLGRLFSDDAAAVATDCSTTTTASVEVVVEGVVVVALTSALSVDPLPILSK